MTLKDRWDAEENKIGKFLKYIIGYCSVFAGIITDLTVNYLRAVSGYVPESVSHTLVSIGVASYVIGKLTVKNEQK